jgi:hypothetical protein
MFPEVGAKGIEMIPGPISVRAMAKTWVAPAKMRGRNTADSIA